MESNTQAEKVNRYSGSSAAVEAPCEKVEIEDCSDGSDQNSVTAVVQLPAKNRKAEEETETQAEVIVEEVGVDSDEEEDESGSDVAETVKIIKKPESAAAVGESNEQSTIPCITQNDNSVGIIVTTTPPTPTTTTPAATEPKSVASTEVAEQQQEEEEQEKLVEQEEKEDREGEKCENSGDVAHVSGQAKNEKVTTDNDAAEIKVKLSENAAPTPKADLSATQPRKTPIDATPPKQQQPQHVQGENWNNTIKDIISDDVSNTEQENITILKQKQTELLEKQQELVQQIRQQQLIARQLAAENRIHKQQLEQQKGQQQTQQEIQNNQTPFKYRPKLTPYHPQENISKYSTIEETQDEHGFIRKTESYETKESSNPTKHIDLQKIFTPATDAEEILPRNRKLYASSAFYSPALHPTVEDQVELARRISHSLSDISNQKSKGQSMYVNRKKRSVKWVHEGAGQDYHQQQVKPPTSPSILPAYSDAGKHRVQLNLHQEQVLGKYVKPGLKVVKTPWEAALETGSASSAFVEDVKLTPHHTPTPTVSPAPVTQYQYAGSTVTDAATYNGGYTADYNTTPFHKLPQARFPTSKSSFYNNPQRDLAYKPSLPQGWKSPCVTLPKELYLPKEISLDGYAPPPVLNIKEPESYKPSRKPTYTPSPVPSSFPLSKPNNGGYLGYGSTPPPKQQYFELNSYKTVQQETTQNVPQISYNPTPLPYDKIAKFENAAEQQTQNNDWNSKSRRWTEQSYGAKVRNASPAPFGERHDSGQRLSPPYPYNVPRNDIYDRATTPVYAKRHNINELLHGQNYNNTARGWRPSGSGSYPAACGGAYNTGLGAGSYGGFQQKPFAAANNLPYTDF